MYRNMFPALRFSRLMVEFEPVRMSLKGHATPVSAPALFPVSVYGIGQPISTDIPAHRNLYLAIKTNMLYDALAVPNIGAELYVGKNWSVTADWSYAWWDSNHRHRYWRVYGGNLGTRYWFGRKAAEKPLTGHHVGVSAGVLTFDFEWGGRGYMGGLPGHNLWDRCMLTAGVEYGYSLPVSRRLNIDFTIGIGYIGGKYEEYKPADEHYVWQSTRRLNWFGPTKAEISLVWLIGNGNFNRKGGSR